MPESSEQKQLLLPALALLLAACTTPAPQQAPPKPRVKAVRTTLPLPEIRGLSGTAADGKGGIYAVLERQHQVIHLGPDPDGPGLVPIAAALPLEGIARSDDAESLARLPDGRLAIGCENESAGRAADNVLLATVESTRVRVTDRVSLPYELWGLRGEANHGIEGLCFTGGYLVAGVEITGSDAGRRYAPVGVYDLAAARWTPLRMWLTSDVGKLAGLDCRVVRDGTHEAIVALAIERDYGVGRLLELRIPLPPRRSDIEPRRVADLFTNDSQVQPNYEGVVRLGADRAVVLSDNHTGSKITDTSVLSLTW